MLISTWTYMYRFFQVLRYPSTEPTNQTYKTLPVALTGPQSSAQCQKRQKRAFARLQSTGMFYRKQEHCCQIQWLSETLVPSAITCLVTLPLMNVEPGTASAITLSEVYYTFIFFFRERQKNQNCEIYFVNIFSAHIVGLVVLGKNLWKFHKQDIFPLKSVVN